MQTSGMPGHLIRRLQQHSSQVFTAHMRQHGWDITSVQFAALDAIQWHPLIDQAGVAALIAYDRPTIGEVVSRLVSKGLVERKVSEADRRARVLTLTQQGEDLVARLRPVVEELQADIVAGLTASEQVRFMELLSKAVARGGS